MKLSYMSLCLKAGKVIKIGSHDDDAQPGHAESSTPNLVVDTEDASSSNRRRKKKAPTHSISSLVSSASSASPSASSTYSHSDLPVSSTHSRSHNNTPPSSTHPRSHAAASSTHKTNDSSGHYEGTYAHLESPDPGHHDRNGSDFMRTTISLSDEVLSDIDPSVNDNSVFVHQANFMATTITSPRVVKTGDTQLTQWGGKSAVSVSMRLSMENSDVAEEICRTPAAEFMIMPREQLNYHLRNLKLAEVWHDDDELTVMTARTFILAVRDGLTTVSGGSPSDAPPAFTSSQSTPAYLEGDVEKPGLPYRAKSEGFGQRNMAPNQIALSALAADLPPPRYQQQRAPRAPGARFQDAPPGRGIDDDRAEYGGQCCCVLCCTFCLSICLCGS